MWPFHSHRRVPTRLTVDIAGFRALCGVIGAVSSSGSGILSVGRAHGRLYRPREPHRRGSPMWSFHSHRGAPTRPTVDTAALHTLCGPTRAVASSGSGILSVGRAHGRLHRPREPHRRGSPMWRFHSHRGVPTRPTVINAASQALYGVTQPLSSSVSGILNVGRTQAPISPPSRAHRRGCPMLCFHSDRGVQTSLSVDTVASQALCGTI